jgi:hypothetical protein
MNDLMDLEHSPKDISTILDVEVFRFGFMVALDQLVVRNSHAGF